MCLTMLEMVLVIDSTRLGFIQSRLKSAQAEPAATLIAGEIDQLIFWDFSIGTNDVEQALQRGRRNSSLNSPPRLPPTNYTSGAGYQKPRWFDHQPRTCRRG